MGICISPHSPMERHYWLSFSLSVAKPSLLCRTLYLPPFKTLALPQGAAALAAWLSGGGSSSHRPCFPWSQDAISVISWFPTVTCEPVSSFQRKIPLCFEVLTMAIWHPLCCLLSCTIHHPPPDPIQAPSTEGWFPACLSTLSHHPGPLPCLRS